MQPRPVPAPVPDRSICQPSWMSDQRTLVRDLTVPFAALRYVRADGSVCRPIGVPAPVTRQTGAGEAQPAPDSETPETPEMIDVSVDETASADALPVNGPAVWLADAWAWFSDLWTPTEHT